MSEYQIGATELRQKLTDVIETIREQNAAYVVETFGRPQVVIISLDEYQQLQEYRRLALTDRAELARATFGMWADRSDLTEDWLKNSRDRWLSTWAEPEDNG